MNFPERLTALQQARGVDKKDVFEAVGLSKMAYYRYEKGYREPPLSTLIALADFFNVSLDYLAGRVDTPAS